MAIDLDAADLIDSLSTGDYEVVRTRRAGFIDGIASPVLVSRLRIRAAVYQASGRDLQRLPEERRSIATRMVYTTTRLFVGAGQAVGPDGAFEADRLVDDGIEWEVQQVGAFPGGPGYFQCIVQAVG